MGSAASWRRTSSIRRGLVAVLAEEPDPEAPPVVSVGGQSADEATAKLAHDRVLLHACGSHGDLTVYRPVTASVHRRQEAPQRRQIRKVPNGATEGGTPGLMLPPDVVHRLARNRDPAARFAGDRDHVSRVRMGRAVVPIRALAHQLAPGMDA